MFEIQSPSGSHLCLAYPPLHFTLRELQDYDSRRRFDETLLRETVRYIIQALDFLHAEAGVVHTGTWQKVALVP